jgi:hypothetical protein
MLTHYLRRWAGWLIAMAPLVLLGAAPASAENAHPVPGEMGKPATPPGSAEGARPVPGEMGEPATPPAPAEPSPTVPASISLAWVGVDADKVGPGSVQPDGIPDGHFALGVNLATGVVTEIKSIELISSDATGAPAGNQRWSTADPQQPVIGVFFQDLRLNSGHMRSLDRFRGSFRLDLFVGAVGKFNPGPFYTVKMALGDGRELHQTAAVSGAASAGQPSGGIHITEATYGSNCGAPRNNAAEHIAKACDGRSRCDYTVDWHQLGDPTHGCEKDYVVLWDCAGGRGSSGRLDPEAGYGKTVTLSCPPGATGPGTAARPEPRVAHTGPQVGTPVITSVSPISPQQNQTITIRGSGFGQHDPYVGNSPFILVSLSSGWNAGWTRDPGGDPVTLAVRSWTDSDITLDGFRGAYGQKNQKISPGDEVTIRVWHPDTLAGPATFSVRVEAIPQ